MPYKFNEKNRDKIDKPHYKVSNWSEYNNALRKRGDFTLYFTEEAITNWHPTRTGSRGSPLKYSDLAIESSLMIRQVFRLTLRQTQGFMNSLVTALQIDISIPDFSSLSKRSTSVPRHKLTKTLTPGSIIIVDSTGLKVYGKNEWNQEKHGVAARRTWRKLHLAVDEKHQVIACELTTPETGDPTAALDLLDQIDTPFDTFMGDGAYDGYPISHAVLNKQPHAQVVVPPPKTAVVSVNGDTQRDDHIRVIDRHGRIAWQKKTGYGMRSYSELAMQRVKCIFGNTMKARKLPQQKAEAWVSVVALNRMTSLGMPASVKI